MTTPAERFAPVPIEQRAVLGLWRPPELAPTGPSFEIVEGLDAIDDDSDESGPPAADPVAAAGASIAQQPVETLDETLASVNAVEIDPDRAGQRQPRGFAASNSGWDPLGPDAC